MLNALKKNNKKNEKTRLKTVDYDTQQRGESSDSDREDILSALMDLFYFDYITDSGIMPLLNKLNDDKMFPPEISQRSGRVWSNMEYFLADPDGLIHRLTAISERDDIPLPLRNKAEEGRVRVLRYKNLNSFPKYTEQAI